MYTANRNVIAAAAQITQLWLTVVAKDSACAAFASATSEPTQRKCILASTANATTSHANIPTISCVEDLIMVFASAATVTASQDGAETTARAVRQTILACHQMAVKFALATASVSAALVNARKRMRAATQDDSVRNARLALVVATNSRNVCSVKSTRPAQWATIPISVLPTAHCSCQKVSRLSKWMRMLAITCAFSMTKTTAVSNSSTTTTTLKKSKWQPKRSSNAQRKFSFSASSWESLHPSFSSVWHFCSYGRFSPQSTIDVNLPNSRRKDNQPNGIR